MYYEISPIHDILKLNIRAEVFEIGSENLQISKIQYDRNGKKYNMNENWYFTHWQIAHFEPTFKVFVFWIHRFKYFHFYFEFIITDLKTLREITSYSLDTSFYMLKILKTCLHIREITDFKNLPCIKLQGFRMLWNIESRYKIRRKKLFLDTCMQNPRLRTVYRQQK